MSQPSASKQVVGWITPVIIVGLLLFGPGVYQLIRQAIRQHHMDQELARLEAEHERLTREQEQLEHNPTYVEGLLRSTFKVAQPGELVVPLEEPETQRR